MFSSIDLWPPTIKHSGALFPSAHWWYRLCTCLFTCREPDVPAWAPLLYQLQLLDVREKADPLTLPVADRIRIGNQKRERGNFHFQREEYCLAARAYRMALDVLTTRSRGDTGRYFDLFIENIYMLSPARNVFSTWHKSTRTCIKVWRSTQTRHFHIHLIPEWHNSSALLHFAPALITPSPCRHTFIRPDCHHQWKGFFFFWARFLCIIKINQLSNHVHLFNHLNHRRGRAGLRGMCARETNTNRVVMWQ